MEQSPYPQELLQASVSERVKFFVNYTMAHPHLIKAFNEVMQSVYHAPGISLIFVVGATGVGKTTLLHRLEQKLTEKALPELKHNQGKIPVIGLEAKAPEFSQFDWKDFYIRLLKVLNEPLVEKKINYGQSCSKWRSAVESALINRSPDAFYIDEAHHLTMLPSGRKLKDQPETLKSLANLTQVKIIPTGTYDLLPLIDLGDQLCRRSKTIHFQRYHAENSQEAKIFKSVVQTFSQYLPLPKRPDLLSNWEFLYERSLGCVGILKDWLSQTVCEVLESDENAQTITLSDLQRHAPTVRQCLVMLKSISMGEQQLQESDEDLLKLQKALKLTNTSHATAEVKGAKSKKGPKTKPKKMIQASPRRYPLKKEEEDTDSFHSL